MAAFDAWANGYCCMLHAACSHSSHGRLFSPALSLSTMGRVHVEASGAHGRHWQDGTGRHQLDCFLSQRAAPDAACDSGLPVGAFGLILEPGAVGRGAVPWQTRSLATIDTAPMHGGTWPQLSSAPPYGTLPHNWPSQPKPSAFVAMTSSSPDPTASGGRDEQGAAAAAGSTERLGYLREGVRYSSDRSALRANEVREVHRSQRSSRRCRRRRRPPSSSSRRHHRHRAADDDGESSRSSILNFDSGRPVDAEGRQLVVAAAAASSGHASHARPAQAESTAARRYRVPPLGLRPLLESPSERGPAATASLLPPPDPAASHLSPLPPLAPVDHRDVMVLPNSAIALVCLCDCMCCATAAAAQ
jgi:hypothetical protein